jgi:hypothetical protein
MRPLRTTLLGLVVATVAPALAAAQTGEAKHTAPAAPAASKDPVQGPPWPPPGASGIPQSRFTSTVIGRRLVERPLDENGFRSQPRAFGPVETGRRF